jgi:putative lipoic acid-binding regulatory protein
MANSELNDQAPGMVYPCTIDVKIFIENSVSEEQLIRKFVDDQLEADRLTGWSSRESSGGKYLAITATVNAQNREHIDAFYQALTDHEHVIMLI